MDDAAWTTGTVLVEGTRLHFHRMGGSGRPVLLLLHGITDDGSCWTRVARDLEADFDIVMPDARGHGRSDSVGPDLSVARLASDVAGLLDELGIAEALAFGHSMGAITAVELAASRPDLVRGCILEDPPFGVLAAPSPERVAEMRTEIASWSTLPAADRHELAAAQNPGWSREETDPRIYDARGRRMSRAAVVGIRSGYSSATVQLSDSGGSGSPARWASSGAISAS